MGIVKLTLHPLFIVLGFLSAIFGGLPVFIIYALTALLHECGHIFCAARLGFKCERIKLMPYGAAAVCDIEGISKKDEIRLSLAGPLVNALICIGTAGLWWFFPETYAFTDTVFSASLVMLAVNLLPAYPLDGGRAVRCLLMLFISERRANLILKISALLLSAALVALFFTLIKSISLLFLAGFLLCSAFEKTAMMTRLNFTSGKIKRGKEIKHIMLGEDSTFKDAIKFLDSGKYCIFVFYGDGVLDEVTEDELLEGLQNNGIYDKILGSV